MGMSSEMPLMFGKIFTGLNRKGFTYCLTGKEILSQATSEHFENNFVFSINVVKVSNQGLPSITNKLSSLEPHLEPQDYDPAYVSIYMYYYE